MNIIRLRLICVYCQFQEMNAPASQSERPAFAFDIIIPVQEALHPRSQLTSTINQATVTPVSVAIARLCENSTKSR